MNRWYGIALTVLVVIFACFISGYIFHSYEVVGWANFAAGGFFGWLGMRWCIDKGWIFP